MIFFAVILV